MRTDINNYNNSKNNNDNSSYNNDKSNAKVEKGSCGAISLKQC